MFNILEADASGVIREHLVSYSKYQETACGMYTREWKCPYDAWVGGERGRRYDFKWLDIMPCYLCGVEGGPGYDADTSEHIWLRDNGLFRQFKLVAEVNRLVERGHAPNDPRMAHLTPAVIAVMRQEDTADTWRDYRECPACMTLNLVHSIITATSTCSCCTVVVSNAVHEAYRQGDAEVQRDITRSLANELAMRARRDDEDSAFHASSRRY